LANDNVTINTGHILTIPNGQIASAGVLNDKGTLRNFGTLNMGKIPTADLYVETLSYHIRGGLRGINLDVSGNLTNSLFSFKLGYETNGFWDGNIGKQEWKSNLDNLTRSFTYRYDGGSRITGGKFAGNGTENYSLDSVNYDLNGNVKMLTRHGYKSNNTFGLVDSLKYTYNTNSNKILKVDDLSNETASFRDIAGNDYGYSLDGSLTSDANKGITLLEYNYLKLPRKVVQNGITTLYQYDAGGKKLKETISTQVTDYSGNKIYKNNVLYQIAHDEGRIIAGEYEYNIKDHLGNLRVAFRDSLGVAKIMQSYAYGVWGEDLPTLSYLKPTWKADNFKFTGKENLQGNGFVDFGARLYDNIVPRFTTIDANSEDYKHLTGYNYAENNPIMKIDPDGNSSENIATQYVDPNGNTIINTNDGRNDVFVVPWNKLKKFKENADNALPEISNSTGWNDYWRSQSTLLVPGSLVDMVHSADAVQKLIKYAITESTEDLFDYVFEEIEAQWKTPELVVGGISAGIGGSSILTMSRVRRSISRQLRTEKQLAEHTLGGKRLQGNSYLNTTSDAKKVINAAHSGEASILGTNVSQNRVYVQYNGVTGYYNNNGIIIPTNKFLIKGGKSASVVPVHPNSSNF
jgi:RHS repeat-associated protein